MFLSHGGRPTKGNGRKRKGVDEYAAENRVDFTSRSIIRDGQLVRILVCRFCCQSIGARSDRIKEHLASKRHQKLKLEAFREAAEAGRDLSQEYGDDSVSGLLPEPPITMLKFPGKALAHLLEADGRPSNRELTPEADDMNYAIPTPPPLKAEQHVLNSPPPQQNHAGQLHSGASSGGIGGGRGSGTGGGSNAGASATPPPPKESSPQQLLCVRWGNYDSNIVTMFSKLRNLEHFVDVTLWCEGRTIKCHKMILSACSTYFETLLTEMPNLHPIIFFKDMRFWEIQALVEFMYKGEVSIHQEKLQSLLRAAESLQIKGLGSPSNEIGGGGGGGGGSASSGNEQGSSNSNGNSNEQHHQQQSNSTGDLPTSSQTHLHNHLIPHHNVSAGHAALNSLHHSLTHSTNHINSIRSDNQHVSMSQHSLMSTPNMGIDLSNHGSGAMNLHSTPLSSSSPQSGVPSKRRKKETPRRIDIPRANLPIANFASPIPPSEDVMDEDDVASDDSMAAHERNHIDGMKSEQATEMTYEDSNDGEGQENYSENYNENDRGNQSHDENSSDQGGEIEDDNEGGGGNGGALSLLINSNANSLERERERERERSRKGNPIKKIHMGIGNNNNNNESLLHSASSAAD